MRNEIGAGSKLSKEVEDRLCDAGWYEAAQRLLCWWIKCKDFGVRMGKQMDRATGWCLGLRKLYRYVSVTVMGRSRGPNSCTKKRREKCNI